MPKSGKIQIIKYAPPPPELPIYGQIDPAEVSFLGRTNYVAALEEKKFVFGIKRVETTITNGATVPVTIDASHRPDLYGVLDSSAVTAAGTFWGIRTNGNSWVQFQGSPMSSGVGDSASSYYLDNWSETSRLTIEFCIQPPSGQLFPTNMPLFSLGAIPTEPSPFTI